ncbi:MAG: acyl-ACP--UDP-N-acetylglucosamine O-acyltransferase [Bacteroidetes bacterium]|nr:acyl-ACP--UDP-N-acetylglucosamine O-acyltransferase [Bacteroidota bacterium]
MQSQIHPTAIVNTKAELGNNVNIGAYSIIEGDVVIDDNVSIGTNVFIDNGARIGKNSKIHKGAVVSTPPQDLKYANEKTFFKIGANTVVREFCTLNRGTVETGYSSVGNNCLLMAYVHVAHDCVVGNNVILANAVQLGGHVTVEDWVIIGGTSPIHQFCKIGQHVMIGGNFRAVKDVPPFIMAGGEPLSFEGLNSIGLRRRGFTREAIDAIHDAYRLLYNSSMNVSQAAKVIEEKLGNVPEVQTILSFIKESKRGIIGTRRG